MTSQAALSLIPYCGLSESNLYSCWQHGSRLPVPGCVLIWRIKKVCIWFRRLARHTLSHNCRLLKSAQFSPLFILTSSSSIISWFVPNISSLFVVIFLFIFLEELLGLMMITWWLQKFRSLVRRAAGEQSTMQLRGPVSTVQPGQSSFSEAGVEGTNGKTTRPETVTQSETRLVWNFILNAVSKKIQRSWTWLPGRYKTIL